MESKGALGLILTLGLVLFSLVAFAAHDGLAGSGPVTVHLIVEPRPVYPIYLPIVRKP